MVTIVAGCAYIGLSLLSYLMDMSYPYEVIFTLMYAFPLYAYARRKKILWTSLFTIQALGIVGRYVVSTVVVLNGYCKVTPISMNIPIIKQMCGVVTIMTWLVWLTIAAYTTYNITKLSIGKAKVLTDVTENKNIIRSTNILSVTSVITIINLLVTVKAYSLSDYAIHIIVFEMIVILISMETFMEQSNMIRRYKEKLITKSDLKVTVVDLDKEDESE